MKTPSAFEEVMKVRGLEMPAEGEVAITGQDPILPTRFKIGEVCASVVAGVGVAVNDIWEQKTGTRQSASVDVKHAAAALKSTRYMRKREINGSFKRVVNEGHEQMIQITQPWPTKDGRWFLPHFGLPNLRERVLGVLGCEFTPESVRDAVATWDALDLEAAIDEARACGAMVRGNDEWLAHPHGQALSAKPIVEVIKIGDSDPEPFQPGGRPLDGIKALDLTRILAGPIAARTLAENGADVLMVTAEGLPQIKEHVIDTSHGKRSCYLDLKSADGVATLRELAKGTDVFSQGYRPSMLEGLGFGPEQLSEIRPGIVYVSISCFGADGPFSHRAGWEQVAQTVFSHSPGEQRRAAAITFAYRYVSLECSFTVRVKRQIQNQVGTLTTMSSTRSARILTPITVSSGISLRCFSSMRHNLTGRRQRRSSVGINPSGDKSFGCSRLQMLPVPGRDKR